MRRVLLLLLFSMLMMNTCHCIGWMNAGDIVFVVNGTNISSRMSAIWPKAIVKVNERNATTTVTIGVIGDPRREMQSIQSIIGQNSDLLLLLLLERPLFREIGEVDRHFYHGRSLLGSSSSSNTTVKNDNSAYTANIILGVTLGSLAIFFIVLACKYRCFTG